MSDIFISYARPDRALAEGLVLDLTSRGYRVWWDNELVGSDDFHQVILQALTGAKAAIVIWTKASSKSKFVYDEARFADHLNKLITTRDPSLDPIDIPFGFGRQHTEDVSDIEKIIRALNKLGVRPPVETTSLDWSKLKTTGSIDEIVAYLGTTPPEQERQAAVSRLKQLAREEGVAKGGSAVVRPLPVSNWWAFISGLTFQVPDFQLRQTEGKWAAIGLSVFLLVISALPFAVNYFIPIEERASTSWWFAPSAFLFWAIVIGAAWRSFRLFVSQRQFLASAIVGLCWIFVAVMLGVVLVDYMTTPGRIRDITGTFWGPFALVSLPGIASLVYIVWSIWRAR